MFNRWSIWSYYLVPKPAEARMSRLEMKKKIMEKAGVSKPKTEKNGMMKSPTPTFPLPLPPPEGTAGPLVEATVKNTAPPNNAS
ncbi:hypothetical protein F3Y22_tig00110893pilonHSYRG00646 [Hibiscus syriacus]|uniref:Uncharacterized protein n=2 Tax=Hibiscus syriacus TaxID=106335 RepID=A0A6A2ZGM3_HIBSY|nr:hypothetical protein F3Y22_tig00110893pilonHSYRG00646 [Hibiscus syriacus]